MNREDVIATLREHEPELKAAGVQHLFLHGSFAQGTAIRELSDVDVIADFDRTKRLSLLGRVHLENRLTDILGIKADLADRDIVDAITISAPQGRTRRSSTVAQQIP